MTTTAVAWAALAIAVVTAICAALTYRLVTVDRHEIDLLRDRADKLRTDIDATRDWTWDHHDAHGWGEDEPEAAPAEPQHPPTALIAAQPPTGTAWSGSPNPYQRLQAGQPPTQDTPRPTPGPQEPRRTRAEERAARREGTAKDA